MHIGAVDADFLRHDFGPAKRQSVHKHELQGTRSNVNVIYRYPEMHLGYNNIANNIIVSAELSVIRLHGANVLFPFLQAS